MNELKTEGREDILANSLNAEDLTDFEIWWNNSPLLMGYLVGAGKHPEKHTLGLLEAAFKAGQTFERTHK